MNWKETGIMSSMKSLITLTILNMEKNGDTDTKIVFPKWGT